MFYSLTRINIPQILRVLGLLTVCEGVFLLIPLAASIYYGEEDVAPFLYTIAATVITGSLMMTCIPTRTHRMAKREGFLLTSSVWVLFSLFGMMPFLLSDLDLTVADAFFEAMSGFTTTGASVLDVAELSHGLILWRCLMQWIGGMGIILFTLAVMPMLNNQGGLQMFNSEVTGITHDKLRPRISQTAKGLWGVYFVLTFALFVLLWLGPMNLFEALCHAFSTMSTGGFSTRPDSIGAWNSNYINIVIILFMWLGGVNFGLIYKASFGDFSAFRTNDTLRLYIRMTAVMLVIFAVCIVLNGQYTGWESVTVDPLFQIVSTMSSTGYTVNSFESWGNTVLSLVFVMMFFGACAGSTSGGAKLDRLNYLWQNTRNEIDRSLNPNTIYTVRINNRVMNSEKVSKVIAFLCIYLMVILAGGILLTTMGMPLIDAFFSAFSCMSNTGLGAGITGYGNNFEVVPVAGKWLLSVIMLIGRLEIFTILVLFTRSFWLK